MKNIGMFYNNRATMLEAFLKHAEIVKDIDFASVNTKTDTIQIGECRWIYYTLAEDKDAMKIAGRDFDAVFSEDLNFYCKGWVMSRFRPRF